MIVAFVCRDCQTFAYMKTLIVTFAVKLPRHVHVWGLLTMVGIMNVFPLFLLQVVSFSTKPVMSGK